MTFVNADFNLNAVTGVVGGDGRPKGLFSPAYGYFLSQYLIVDR